MGLGNKDKMEKVISSGCLVQKEKSFRESL